jgi:hypothetical protein
MKKTALLILLTLPLTLGGCGTTTPLTTVTTTTSGNWEAQLTGGTGQASKLNFVTTFTVTNINGQSAQPLTITGFSFFNTQPCFVSRETESGNATLNTNTANQVTGSMNYTVTSGVPPGNMLTLTADPTKGGGVSGTANGTPGTTGKLSNGVAMGTWTLTGGGGDSSCGNQSGTFIMCQGSNTCTPP